MPKEELVTSETNQPETEPEKSPDDESVAISQSAPLESIPEEPSEAEPADDVPIENNEQPPPENDTEDKTENVSE